MVTIKEARHQSLLIRGERLSAIVCMSMNGILDVKIMTGTVLVMGICSVTFHTVTCDLMVIIPIQYVIIVQSIVLPK